MARRLAERVVAWRWYIIAGWIVLGIVLIALAPSLSRFTSAGYGLPSSYQSTQAQAIALATSLRWRRLRASLRSTPPTTRS